MEKKNNNQKYILSHLAGIFHTGVFCLQEEQLIFYEESPEYNPIYNNETIAEDSKRIRRTS